MFDDIEIKEVEPTEAQLLKEIQAKGRADNPELDPKDVCEIPEEFKNIEVTWNRE